MEITKCVCSDNCTEINVEFDSLEVINRSYNITSLTFDPKAGGLTYADGKAIFTGSFKYCTLEEPEKEVVASGSVTFNIKALDNIVLDSDEQNTGLELHLDQDFITRVTMLEIDKADIVDLNETNELLDQVQKAQAADSIAIVGLQSEVITAKEDIKRVESIAKGKSGGEVFADYSTMISTVNGKSKTSYILGQSFLIETLDVPDLWVSGISNTSTQYTYVSDEVTESDLRANGKIQVGFFILSVLETRKIDLTNYPTRDELFAKVDKEMDVDGTTTVIGRDAEGVVIRSDNDYYSANAKFDNAGGILFGSSEIRGSTNHKTENNFSPVGFSLSGRVKNSLSNMGWYVGTRFFYDSEQNRLEIGFSADEDSDSEHTSGSIIIDKYGIKLTAPNLTYNGEKIGTSGNQKILAVAPENVFFSEEVIGSEGHATWQKDNPYMQPYPSGIVANLKVGDVVIDGHLSVGEIIEIVDDGANRNVTFKNVGKLIDSGAREANAQLSIRMTELENTLGDVSSLLDTINGEEV